jgi:hypothetical protein
MLIGSDDDLAHGKATLLESAGDREGAKSGEQNVAKLPKGGGDREKGEAKPAGEEGVGSRFKKGSDDLDQLKGLERQRDRSRRARRKLEQDESAGEPDPDLNYPRIETDDKSRRRVKNRFQGIKDPEGAIDEFGS